MLDMEMKKLIKLLYNKSYITIDFIAQIAIDQKIFLKEDIVIKFSKHDVNKFREYDRNLTGRWSGSQSNKEVDKLRKSIKKSGIKEPLIIKIDVTNKKQAGVYIGEGNHRIGLAMEDFDLFKVPVKFMYLK